MYVDCLLQQIIVFILTKFNLDRERLNRAAKLKLNLQLDEQLVKEVETDFTIFEDCVSNYFLAVVECKGTCADEADCGLCEGRVPLERRRCYGLATNSTTFRILSYNPADESSKNAGGFKLSEAIRLPVFSNGPEQV